MTLYRLYAKDPNFHSLCDDWLEAAEACKRWQAADGSNAEKGAEYRLLASEDRDGDPDNDCERGRHEEGNAASLGAARFSSRRPEGLGGT